MLNQLKIAMLVPHAGSGGDWTAVKLLSQCLLANEHFLVLATTGAGKKASSSYNQFVEIYVNQGILGFIKSLREMKYFPEDLTILHAHSPITLLYALILRRLRCRRASVLMSYHWETSDSHLRSFFKQQLFKRADCIHCYSQRSLRHICNYYKKNENQTALIYWGTDLNKFAFVSNQEKKAYRSRYQFPEESLILAFAGRLSPEKNVGIILEFLGQHKDRYSNVYLLVAGDGPCNQQLKDEAQRNGISERIHFLGRVSDMRAVYGATDLLLLPSIAFEVSPFVVVEAGACGTPCLRSNLGGASDQIEEGVNGAIYPVNEPDQFHGKLAEMLESPDKMERMRRHSHQIANQKFNIKKTQENFEKLYIKLSR